MTDQVNTHRVTREWKFVEFKNNFLEKILIVVDNSALAKGRKKK